MKDLYIIEIYVLTFKLKYLCHTYRVKELPIILIGPIFHIKGKCFALFFDIPILILRKLLLKNKCEQALDDIIFIRLGWAITRDGYFFEVLLMSLM